MALDCAKGMAYLHKQTPYPIIHRDLKSQNLLVTSSFGVKVADFGLARHTADNNTATMTMQVGTPIWTAPEVLRSTQYSVKADVYSFGIIMWEILTRGSPYPELNQFELIMRVVEGERPKVPEGCPAAWMAVMKSAWADNAESRPSFLELIPQLENMLVDAATFPPPLNLYDDEEEMMSRRQQFYKSTDLDDDADGHSTTHAAAEVPKGGGSRKSQYVPPSIPCSSSSVSPASSQSLEHSSQQLRQQQGHARERKERTNSPHTLMGYTPPSLSGDNGVIVPGIVVEMVSSSGGRGVDDCEGGIGVGDNGVGGDGDQEDDNEGIDKPLLVVKTLGPRKVIRKKY